MNSRLESLEELIRISDRVLFDTCSLGFNFLGNSTHSPGDTTTSELRKMAKVSRKFLDLVQRHPHVSTTDGVVKETIKGYSEYSEPCYYRRCGKSKDVRRLRNKIASQGKALIGTLSQRAYPEEGPFKELVVASWDHYERWGNFPESRTDEGIIGVAVALSSQGHNTLVVSRDGRMRKILVRLQRILYNANSNIALSLEESPVSITNYSRKDGTYRVPYSSCDFDSSKHTISWLPENMVMLVRTCESIS